MVGKNFGSKRLGQKNFDKKFIGKKTFYLIKFFG